MSTRRRPPVIGVGFLLAQLGAHSSMRYAELLAPFDLMPPHVGLMNAIDDEPGRSQQALADQFGMLASRMVTLIDDLQQRGLVERRRNPADRRVHLIHLTERGAELLAEVGAVGRAAERGLLHALTAAERHQLADLLVRVADDQGLRRGVHPGFHRLHP